MHGKKATLSQFPGKKITKLLKITDQPLFFLFLVRFFRKSYLVPFLDISKGMVYSDNNQVFNLLIHVGINYFLLLMTCLHHLV